MTFDLTTLQSANIRVSTAWIDEQTKRAARVARYRRYAEGDHDANMTTRMRQMLRVKDSTDPFALNYCDVVVQYMADRCRAQTIEADTDDGSEWIQGLLDDNRFDALQTAVHEAAIRDGDSFIMVSYDNDTGKVVLTFEEAFDGDSGMLTVYRSATVDKMDAAIKVWQIESPEDQSADTVLTRVNIYYPDRVEKYQALSTSGSSAGQLEPYNEDGEQNVYPWVMRTNEPLGIPVIHFRNAGRRNYGASELRNVITPQNALNRFFYSAVMAAELTAFQILVAIGFEPPSEITPGAIVKLGVTPIPRDQLVDLKALPPGDMSQILSVLRETRQSIATISRTPAPELMGSDASSGEALKQREAGLIAKAKKFQVRGGNSWEDTAMMGAKVQAAYGTEQPPLFERAYTKWQSPEIRNDVEVVDNALKLRDIVGDKQTLRHVAGVYDFDEAAIEKIIMEKTEETSGRLSTLGASSNLPGFGAFQGMQDQMNGQGAMTGEAPETPMMEGEMMGGEAQPMNRNTRR